MLDSFPLLFNHFTKLVCLLLFSDSDRIFYSVILNSEINIFDVSIHCNHYPYWCFIFPSFSNWRFFKLVIPFDTVLIVFISSLAIWYKKMFSASNLELAIFQGAQVSFEEVWYLEKTVSQCANCYWIV